MPDAKANAGAWKICSRSLRPQAQRTWSLRRSAAPPASRIATSSRTNSRLLAIGATLRGSAGARPGRDGCRSAHLEPSLRAVGRRGRIVLQRDHVDSAGAATIQAHMRHVAAAFAVGDSRLPGFVHAREVPGTATMAARRALIQRGKDREMANAQRAAEIRGKTIRLTWLEGPTKGTTHEHLFHEDGTVEWRSTDGPQKGRPEDKPRKGEAAREKVEYAAVKVADGIYAVSYLAGSGFTLTVVLNFHDHKTVGFASSSNEWHPVQGTFTVVK
jgi:molybdenum cofactor biosynthesis MoaF-like protein